MEDLKKFILDYVEQNKEDFLKASKFIWENPELGMEEYSASKRLVELLQKNGFSVEQGSAGMPTAFVASYGTNGPVIGFSAEYDALPGLSQKVSSVKSPVHEGWPGHGCGHNLLAVGGILAAVALKEALIKFKLEATIKVFGTPAEELCIGKPVMADAGLFKGVDLFLDWHPFPYSLAGVMTCPAYFNIKYHFSGRTAHGNSPWHGRSALDAAILQGLAVEMLREHIKPGKDEYAANTVNYTFSNTGPEFPSVVPDKATAWYVGRFTNSSDLPDIIERIDRCAEGAALATGTTVSKEYITATHEMIPNKTVAKVIYDNLMALGEPDFTEEEQKFALELQDSEGQARYEEKGIWPFGENALAVTDSSEYSWFAPYSLASLKLAPGPGWHNWMVAACAGGSHGQKTTVKASQLLAASACDFLQNPKLLSQAKKEFDERMQGKTYSSLLPEGTPIPLKISEKSMERYR